jgi:two-component system sensor histidine kinase ChvG
VSRLTALARRLPRLSTRIAARVLLFNLLLVFLPVAGLLYLDTYERHLLEQQERAMVDAGRILAAALGGDPVTADRASALTTRLAGATDARLRVVDRDGRVLADTHAGRPDRDDGASRAGQAADPVRSSWLYRVGAAIAGAVRPLYQTPSPMVTSEPIIVAPGRIAAPEIDRALEGRYGATTRVSPGGQRSMTLYSALPVWQGGDVVAAVLVSQSTWRLLQRLYDVRLRMVSVVALSVIIAIVLTAVASLTIVRPIRQLRDDAESLADRRGRLVGRFRGVARRDEVGELARALDDLTRRLETQLRFSERFAADVTHEFRNPLASIRASAEVLVDEPDAPAAERLPFLTRIERDIARLESLLSGAREMTLVDTQLEEDPRALVDLRTAVADAANRQNCRVTVPADPLNVLVSTDRLMQILTNLIDNAESFTPDGQVVEIAATADSSTVSVTVRDHGPGIAPDHLTRIFDRFFCYRPGQPDAHRRHTGLGLPIAKAIAESYGGSLEASNHPDGGAVFELRLPRR